MSLEESKGVMAATRHLTALEGAIQGLLNEARSGKVNPAMVSIKLDILQSLWNDGNKALLKLEEFQGAQPRRATFMEAYATTKFELKRIGLAEAPASPQFDVTLAPGPSRSDHLPLIELPRFNGDPTEWPAFAARFEKRVAGLTGDAERYAFLTKCFELCDIARNSYEAFENSGMPFSNAWSKLEERFYKKRVAFLGHLKNVIDTPKITKASSTGLMRIIDVVDTSISSAHQIAGESGTKPTVVEDGLLVQLVLGKLDDDTILRITSRLDAQTIPPWKELREELDRLSSQIYYEPRRRETPRYDRAQSTTQPAPQPRVVLSATTGTSQPSNATRPSYKGVSILHGQEAARRCYACANLAQHVYGK
uniref:Uncharacterized protein n=1 Tax=Anopheles stephensi TaxID=30069 RepID=A0A182XXZ5_ANOST